MRIQSLLQTAAVPTHHQLLSAVGFVCRRVLGKEEDFIIAKENLAEIYKRLIIIIFQASFLIPPDLIPGRITLLVTLFLVLINIFNNVNAKSPPVEGYYHYEMKMTTN